MKKASSKDNNRLKWTALAFLFTIHSLLGGYAVAQTGSWHAFPSYYEPQQIVKAGELLFVRASNSLYSYNLTDHSIETFDKVRQMNDTYMSHIAWNQQVKRLIVVYRNGNIDLVDQQGNVVNISALYAKSMMQDKTVNSVYTHQQYAYLATGFGIVKVNMQRAEISESYILNQNITDVAVAGDSIYAQITDVWTESNGTPVLPYRFDGDIEEFIRNWNKTGTISTVIRGAVKDNLIDPHNWTLLGDAPEGTFTDDLTDWNEYIGLVETLQPGGPKYNNFGFMRLKNGTLYTCGAGYEVTNDMKKPATIQLLRDGEWTMLDDNLDDIAEREGRGWTFVDMMTVDVDPNDDRHIIGAGRPGLFEYYDGRLVNYYNKDNSPLENATVSTSNKFVLTESVMFDHAGNLWMLQSQTLNNSIVELTADSLWVKHPQADLMQNGQSLPALQYLFEDSRGLIWFVNNHFGSPSFHCYDPATDQMVHTIRTITNQDGITYSIYYPRCIAEDLEGNIWIGTSIGPFLIEKDNIRTQNPYCTQVKVPRNDGTNYADYLMSGANINCMAIDGAGRKWIGTAGGGAYLISADNMEQLLNFTTENSPLLSDIVESIAIDHETGEVFFGTAGGLCSYMSDASIAAVEMVKDDVYAYPNPVYSGYDGLITIVGLTLDADVKILSTSGQLVAQGRSNGGTFTWNGRDRSGRRVASGVYMVATATSDGKKGTVCKIAVIK